ncbi:SIS domain-containing protein [Deinococcus deserti]|nr:SIS domain-containing protein [Deinococcus deserti]
MLQETREAPEVIRRQIVQNMSRVQEIVCAIRERPPKMAVTIARGSSDHACSFLKYGLETQLSLPVASIGPSVHTLYGAQLDLQGALVLAVSQSGASPDVVETLRMARQRGGLTVALVNVEDSALAHAAEFVLPLQCGEERAVAATKSYLASLTAFLPVVAQLSGDLDLDLALAGLPEVLKEILALEERARDLAERYRFIQQLVVLARGMHFGVAQEAALKLVETCGIQASAFSAAEFSHGPKRLLVEGVPVLAFTSLDAAANSSAEAYQGLHTTRSDLRTIGPASESTLRTMSTGHALTDPVGSAVAFYLFAAHLAVRRGLDPDHPPLLSKVTQTR